MWLKTNDFSVNPLEDFVLNDCAELQATIPLPILKLMSEGLAGNIFSAILYESAFAQDELALFDKLINSLQDKGILVVSLGGESPNSLFAQELLETINQNPLVIQPALMTRFTNIMGQTSYAFRFKKKLPEPSEEPQKKPKELKKTSQKRKKTK